MKFAAGAVRLEPAIMAQLCRSVLIAMVSVLVVGCAAQTSDRSRGAAPRLQQMWRVSGLANPESAALSADRTFLYVTNVNGEGDAQDGNGTIARISVDGAVLDREWARGLNAPKGVVLHRGLLYVADIDELVVLDAATGAVVRRVPVPGARFLNDVAIAPDGSVLIADSQLGKIYVVRGGASEVWLEHDLLQSVNGLLPDGGSVLATTMRGRLLSIDYSTRIISTIAEGLGNADGITTLGEGAYLVSAWPGELFAVDELGAWRRILDTRAENRYLNDMLLVGSVLYVPHWEPGELSAYRIER